MDNYKSLYNEESSTEGGKEYLTNEELDMVKKMEKDKLSNYLLDILSGKASSKEIVSKLRKELK